MLLARVQLQNMKLKRYLDILALCLFPLTGRTHQIRVHASYCGHPIFGDEKYGGGISRSKGFYQSLMLTIKR